MYYAKREDAEPQDLLFCIGDGRALDDPDRPTKMEGDYSLRSGDEMDELFSHIAVAAKNTRLIADKIHLEIPYGQTLIPTFTLNTTEQEQYEKYLQIIKEPLQKLDSEEWNLRRMCMEGLNKRYDWQLSDEIIHEFINKKTVEKSEKKLSEMSVNELIELSQNYFTPKKQTFIAAFPQEKRTIIERLEYELTVVDLMGFNGYFNIVADFINYAKSSHVPV